MSDKHHAGRVLVVDDEAPVLGLVSRILQAAQFDVCVEHDPRSALRTVHDHASEICLLLTDIVMGEMSGIELAAAVHRTHPEIPIVFMTGYADLTAVHGPVVSKPFSPPNLVAAVEHALEPRRKAVRHEAPPSGTDIAISA